MDKCTLHMKENNSCPFKANDYLCSIGRHNPDRFMGEN